jgi:hypothetical protein
LFRSAALLARDGWGRAGSDWVNEDGGRFVPLYEAKMIHQFDHRFGTYGARGDTRGYRVLPQPSPGEYADPTFEVEPFYWVEQENVDDRLLQRSAVGWLVGWKDVTAATNERTVIFSVIPRIGVGHTMPLIFSTAESVFCCGMLANLNSLVLDYAARQSVGENHLTYGYLEQFPVLPPAFYTEPRLAFVRLRVLKLSYTSHSLAPFARDLGHDGPPFPWNPARRADLRAELDAFYARAYRLSRDELRYILDPAEIRGSDYPSETFRVMKEKELHQHGEYRTARLVLAAWDRMEADGTFTALGW